MDYDIVIVGAGISGINAAYRLQTQLPNHRYTILEARDAIGGTWDLFKYPGIRSDSDLFTFGFPWNAWHQDNPIAEGASISKYMRDAAAKFGIDKHIQFQHRLLAADWSSSDHVWKLGVDQGGELKSYTARFVIFGTGYYNYHEPLAVEIPGLDQFQGQIIHPQFWPQDLDYTGKQVVIIGSGATAITLLPKLAEKAAKATMLQRSPTYILALPNRQISLLRYILPTGIYHQVQRLRWMLVARIFFLFCQTFPWLSRLLLKLSVVRQLPKHVPFDPHFKPRYNPWDQRMCISPDGDFFQSLHTGRADVKTDTIRQVTATGIELNSGESLPADIIVTATGLQLQIAGGTSITVDGEKQRIPDKHLWNGVMMQDLPNAAFVIGYTNISWTLGADATALFICRLLKHMEQHHKAVATPRLSPTLAQGMQQRQLLNLQSTYVAAAEKNLPKAADRGPWKPRDNYFSDLYFVKYGRIDEGLEWVDGPQKKQQ